MTKPTNPLRIVRRVLKQAEQSEDAQHRPVAPAGISPGLARLREWQSARIARTYHDFAVQPMFKPALDFFLTDLYGPHDFTQRDYDAERAYRFLSKVVPAEMLTMVTETRALIYLTYALDERLLGVLETEGEADAALTTARYADAYRRCDNIGERELQIDLTVRVLRAAADTARFPLARPALRMVRGPAHKAGWHELYGFLERGHSAFSKVKKPELLLTAIQARETKIMRHILSGAADPFEI
jgi:hypothetical protein